MVSVRLGRSLSLRRTPSGIHDFRVAFALREDDKDIHPIDSAGVALAGVQALYRLSLEKDAQIRKLTAEVNRLKNVEQQLGTLEARLAQIEARTANHQPRNIKRATPAKLGPGSVTLAKAQF